MILTYKEWAKVQPKIRPVDALEEIWRDWCQDEKCPNNPWYGAKVGMTLRIKLPKA